MTGPSAVLGTPAPEPGAWLGIRHAGMPEAATTTETGAEGIAWDLSDLYGGREIGVLPVEDPESTHQCVLPLDHPGRCGFALD